MIEVMRAQGTGIAGEFAETANVGAIVHLNAHEPMCTISFTERTASSADSMGGLFGNATMVFLSA